MDVPELAARRPTALEHSFTDRSATAALPARAVSAGHALVVPLFASTMFASGLLLFMVEPMVARMVLPILGGVPMVWNGCVVFFQIVMLAGYGYAFGASRWLGVKTQVLVHAAILAAPAAVLPFMIAPGSVTPPSGNPLGWLLLLLAGSIGLPFFVLSTSASVFQHWLSRTDHRSARDPYFLYSASNLGCLLALASYPVVVETTLTLGQQARLWAYGYGIFVALAIGCGVLAWRRSGTAPAHETAAAVGAIAAQPAVTVLRRAQWVVLAFVPSSLMLGVTSYLSTDIAAVPLLWIVPLALYLLTFALAFGRHAAAAGAVGRRALPLLAVPLALFMVARVRAPLTPIVLIHLAAFAVMALNCHTELARDRPGPSHLTEFYFWISFGGMLGGLFNTLAAPVLFTSVVEYPLAVLLACLWYRAGDATSGGGRLMPRDLVVPVVVGSLTAGALLVLSTRSASLALQLGALSIPVFIAFTQRRHPVRFGWSIAAFFAASLAIGNPDGQVLYATRTFFGVYRVSEDPTHHYHGLAHGTTLHGMQALAPDRRREALTYYHETGPFGQAWRALPSAAAGREIAAVGLGVGTLATYAGPAQRWTFFEIDPAIERIARTRDYFSFMESCGDRCRVVVGDARVSLARAPEHAYDLLVLDAFSSDSIPIHLMTREALSLYVSRLAPGGAILMHVSNRHLRLGPVIAKLAASEGLVGLQELESDGPNWPEGKSGSHWIVMARSRSDLGKLVDDLRWAPLVAPASTPLWTDDFSNILSVLDLR
jgi:hypothetical protein